ncbi:MAG: hypothetical protein AAF708_09610, partial [Deinococcota bacterium]
GIAIILLINRINPNHPWVTADAAHNVATYAITLVILALVACWLGLGGQRWRLETRVHAVLVAVQASLPLLFVVLIPTPWELNGERWFGYQTTFALPIFITLLISAAYTELAFRVNRNVKQLGEPTFNPGDSLSMLATGSILILMKFSSIALPYVSGDDYHFGENLLPWWTLQDAGAVPFVDYVPAHGLMNYLPGLFANLFFDGTAGTYNAAMVLAAACFLLVAYVLLARAIGILPAFMALLLMPLDIEIRRTVQFAFTATLCLLSERWLRHRPSVWLVLWGTLGLKLFLFVSGQGALLILATLPLALWMFYRAIRVEPKKLGYAVLGIAVVGAGLLLTTDLLAMIWGALRYGLENSAVYEAAYAVPWADRFNDTRPLNRWLWEVLRISWLFVAALAVVITVRTLTSRAEAITKSSPQPDGSGTQEADSLNQNTSASPQTQLADKRAALLFVSIPIALLLLLLIPYALGRIDRGLSRAGIISAWSMSTLLPLLLVRAFPKYLPTILLVTTLTGGLLIQSNLGVATRPARLLRIASYAIDTADVTLTDASELGLPRLGTVIMAERDLARLQNVHATLSQVVRPGETYLDLSNRNAHYFYFGMLPPIESGAIYNLPNSEQQARAVEDLVENPPPIVLAQARNIAHDGGSNALRAHLIYRFVLENYMPMQLGQQVYMVRPDRYALLEKYRSAGASNLELANYNAAASDDDEEGVSWKNGIRVADDSEASPAIKLTSDVVTVAPGDVLSFASGERTVSRVEQQTVWLEGGPLEPTRDGYPNAISAQLQEASDDANLALLDSIFRQSDLRQLPIAWADSYESLQDELVPVLDLEAEGIVQLRPDTSFLAPNWYSTEGSDPGVTYYFPAQDLAARDAGILGFTFNCWADHVVAPQLEIFFSGDDMPDPRPQMRIVTVPRNGTMLIPLDAYPRWLVLKHAKQIRFDLSSQTVGTPLCDGFEISNVQLYQRRSVAELEALRAPLAEAGQVSALP